MLPNFLDFVSLGKDVRKIKHSSLAGMKMRGLGWVERRPGKQIVSLPRRPTKGWYVLGIPATWLASRQWMKEVDTYIYILFQSQKLNNRIVRLLISVVPAAGMVHPTCRLGALK